jgi:hypothetical protein
MSFSEKTELLKAILREFPLTVFLEKTIRKQNNPYLSNSINEIALAKLSNPFTADSKACKPRVPDSKPPSEGGRSSQ